MFIKRMMRIHCRAKEALAFHYIEHQERTDGLCAVALGESPHTKM
jgi:hypothetical protein